MACPHPVIAGGTSAHASHPPPPRPVPSVPPFPKLQACAVVCERGPRHRLLSQRPTGGGHYRPVSAIKERGGGITQPPPSPPSTQTSQQRGFKQLRPKKAEPAASRHDSMPTDSPAKLPWRCPGEQGSGPALGGGGGGFGGERERKKDLSLLTELSGIVSL